MNHQPGNYTPDIKFIKGIEIAKWTNGLGWFLLSWCREIGDPMRECHNEVRLILGTTEWSFKN